MNDYVWQRCLDVSRIDSTSYHENARPDLVEMLDIEPQRVLDIGCAAGATGAFIKNRYPGATVWGIELNQSAADKARERIDHVAVGKFEEVDLDTLGIAPQSLDFVLIADVLEHMYDPWAAMQKIHRYLAPSGRLVISIPNIRFLPLLDDLARGYWRYADFGILDITHLRFFTLKELRRFLHETGFSVAQLKYGLDPALRPQFEAYQAKLPCDIETDKIVLRNVDEGELIELFSGQFFVMATPGATTLADYEPPKLGCSFWKGEQTDYEKFLQQHQMLPHEGQAFETLLNAWRKKPLIEVFVLANAQTLDNLALSIHTLSLQYYPDIRVQVLGEGSAPPALARPGRISWVDHHGKILECLNKQVAQSHADWVAVLQSGDQLLPQTFLYLVELAERQPQMEACYVDEDALGTTFGPNQPYFKPDISPEYLESFPYIGDGFYIRQRSWKALNGLRPELGAAAFYALQLQLLASKGPAAFGHLADIHFRRHPLRSLQDNETGLAKLSSARTHYLQTLGISAQLLPGKLPGSEHIRREIPAEVSVCLIIEIRQHLQGIKHLLEKLETLQQGIDLRFVILLNDELAQEDLQFLASLDEAGGDRFQVYPLQAGMCSSAAINSLAQSLDVTYLCLFPEDGVAVETNWLQILLATATSPGVAAVAPRLLQQDGSLQGNSLLLGSDSLVQGEGHKRPHDEPGYFGRWLIPHNPGALTPDCLLISRAALLQAGGLDEMDSLLATMVDLAQKFHQQALRLVWTPFASIVSTTLTANLDQKTGEILLERWLPQLARDPAYNPNFSRESAFQLLEKPQVSRLGLPWKPLPRLLAFPADDAGCGHYRVIEPFGAAIAAGKIDGYCGFDHYSPYELAQFAPDALLLQRQISDIQLHALRNYQRFFDCPLIFELDDLITNVPVRSLHKAHMAKDIPKRLREALALCSRFVVSTAPLAEAYKEYHHDIVVMPNYIDMSKWGNLQAQRRAGKKPRVGWAGGVSHSGDLALVFDVVKALANDVEWVFFGMCPDEIRPFVAEFHVGIPTPEYPAKLASLNLDLAIAPLEHNDFNLCKSNLKLLEYGALGYPVIASDFGPYQGDFPITRVRNRFKDWQEAIQEHLSDLDACALRGDVLRETVRKDWSLQAHVDDWYQAWFKP